MKTSRVAVLCVFLIALAMPDMALSRTLVADPGVTSGPNYYRTLLGQLVPGDTLLLPAGTYRDRLAVAGLNGTPSAWIVITGPSSGPPAVITTTSTCCNTVQLDGTSYLALKNLTVDSAGLDAIDGINAKGNPTHDILIEGCTLVGQSNSQGTVAISTKSPAWRWTIRGNRLIEPGTGIYLGNSDGTQPFIAGVIEGNLFHNSIGYNMEIKHQLPYAGQSWTAQLPPGPHRTVIRHNVFIKEKTNWPPGAAVAPRPNLLVDPFPDTGLGSSDWYEVHGNFFYKNPQEALFQATGRLSIHDNVFVASGAGMRSIALTDHNGPLKVAYVYNNTVYSAAGGGIGFSAPARVSDAVVGNLILTNGGALTGPISDPSDNVIAAPGTASQYFVQPSETLGQMDFYPRAGCAGCSGPPLSMTPFTGDTDYTRDFNGVSKAAFSYRGAYAGEGVNPGWRLQAGLKTIGGGSNDTVPPAPISDVRGR